MPHLSELQQKYKDQGVDVIGIAVWEREPTAQAKIDKVSEFLTSGDWPEKTKYTLAVDKDDMMANGYMKASGQGGIPTAFIVGKDGKIEWIGHPMSMDEPLAQIVAGTYDMQAAKEQMIKAQAFDAIMQQAQQKMMTAFQAQDWDELMSIMDGLKEQAPGDMLPQIQMQQFTVMAAMANKPEEATRIATEIIAEHGDDAQMMNALAWTIATDPRIQEPNLDLALKAANAGVKASEGQDPSVLDTLATVQGKMGDYAEAIKTEEKALGMVEDGDMKAEFEAKIAEWKAAMATTG